MTQKVMLALVLTCVWNLTGAAETDLDMAVNLVKAKKYAAAKTLLETQCRKHPESGRALYALGYTNEMLGSTREAMACYAKVIMLNRQSDTSFQEVSKGISRLAGEEPGLTAVLRHALDLMSQAGKLDGGDRIFVEKAGTVLLEYAIDDNNWKAAAANPEVVKQQTKRISEIESSLGYKLGRHPRGASRLGKDKHWYKYFPQQLSWQAASERCRKMGGYQVTVTDLQEKDIMEKLARRQGGSVWLGGTVSKGGEIKWATGELADPVIVGKWHVGPNLVLHLNGNIVGVRASGQNAKRAWIIKGFACEWNY